MWPFRKRVPKPRDPRLCQTCDWSEVSSGQQMVPHPPHPPLATAPPPPPPPYAPEGLIERFESAYAKAKQNGRPLEVIQRCRGSLYEPGVRHEHTCLASMAHDVLDHTCECGRTWPNLSPFGTWPIPTDQPDDAAATERLSGHLNPSDGAM